jgi:hypothetical protein
MFGVALLLVAGLQLLFPHGLGVLERLVLLGQAAPRGVHGPTDVAQFVAPRRQRPQTQVAVRDGADPDHGEPHVVAGSPPHRRRQPHPDDRPDAGDGQPQRPVVGQLREQPGYQQHHRHQREPGTGPPPVCQGEHRYQHHRLITHDVSPSAVCIDPIDRAAPNRRKTEPGEGRRRERVGRVVSVDAEPKIRRGTVPVVVRRPGRRGRSRSR